MTQQFPNPSQGDQARSTGSNEAPDLPPPVGDVSVATPPPAQSMSAPSPPTVQALSTPAVVTVGAVAGQVAEYIEIPGKGAVKMASMTQRLIARVLDGVILSVALGVTMGLGIVLFTAAVSVDDGSGGAAGMGFLGFLGLMFVAVLLVCVYEAVMVGLWGATVGKMILKVKVVKPRHGGAPGIGAGTVRFLIPGVCSLIPVVGWIGTIACYLSPTFDPTERRQGWHDKVANTIVVSTAV